MAVPVFIVLCVLGVCAESHATTVDLDERSFAVIVPIKAQDRSFNVTVTTIPDECFDGQTVFDEPEIVEPVEEKAATVT